MSNVSRTRLSLEESENRLGMAEKLAAVGKFAACAAHEIRSPLTSMRMWLYELRRNSRNPSEVEQHCKVLEAEVGRLEELATSFLHFSRPPSLRLAPQDVHSIIDCTLELARHRLEAKGLRVVRVNGSVLPLIMADENQLRQVVLNLISNAADAAPERGEIRIIETTESDPEGHPAVVVRVQDTGPGVSKDVREHLFEPFVTTKPNGTGLGLCVSSSIVVQHGGRLALEPGEGPGATFAIYLPACGD
jgi:signal transduction histidine kinase